MHYPAESRSTNCPGATDVMENCTLNSRVHGVLFVPIHSAEMGVGPKYALAGCFANATWSTLRERRCANASTYADVPRPSGRRPTVVAMPVVST